MIPSVVARQVRHAIEEYLTTQYAITTPRFANTLSKFVQEGELFKGPFVSFQLPFELGTDGTNYFPHIPLSFRPYLHQQDAFDRLSGPDPKPTIVATGTGSGKTESFLYPILEHCRLHSTERGVKAILIYPMNALANDQAKRIARIIYNTPSLKGQVTAGLYVGGPSPQLSSGMTADRIITKRETMHEQPPDILLTNYKMLDYLLIQPKTKDIWKENLADGLQFIVVDELHTFDGAQGTDLACLLRRLKHRLRSPNACPVGTSATLETDDTNALLNYAKDIFGTTFGSDSIISENRLSSGEFTSQYLWKTLIYPDGDTDLDLLDPNKFDTLTDYIAAQYGIWFGNNIEEASIGDPLWAAGLGADLMKHGAFKNLIQIVESTTMSLADIAGRFEELLVPEIREHTELVLESLLALISFARHPDNPERPLLNVRVEFWIRELTRMLVSTGEEAHLRWFDDLKSPRTGNESEVQNHFPLIICRKCGKSGWGGTRYSDEDPLESSPSKFYEAFFRRSANLSLIFPDDSPPDLHGKQLCLTCLNTVSRSTKSCESCNASSLFSVHIPSLPKSTKNGISKVQISCPYCAEKDSFSILGAQSASLCSVGIGQLFGSRYNDDKKVITFSNSVQDASHRAGFFQARTYQFAIRTSLFQHIVDQADGQTLSELQVSYVKTLRAKYADAEFVGRYVAPNMTWRNAYKELVQYDISDNLEQLIEGITKRLEYEILLIFGLQSQLGRNLEKTRSVTAAPNTVQVKEIADEILDRMQNEIGGLRDLTVRQIRQFITGLIYRLRISGGISTPTLGSYINSKGNGYCLSDSHRWYMPRSHPRFSRPAFICDYTCSAFLPIGKFRQKTWIREWATKCLFEDELHADPASAVFIILKALVKKNLLKQYGDDLGHRTWGIAPECLTVTTDLVSVRCTQCKDEACLPSVDRQLWDGMPCTRYKCQGHMEPVNIGRQNYYHHTYKSYDTVRVVAEEHTGLLSRKQRELVENKFMRKGHQPWDPNVLSCTPTLELGVDIGDLSTVFQAAMPPQRANYVQRIGRAGRRDGNAFALTIASAKPHDLYFFADPKEMLAGKVDIPGIYLKAPAVLQRQLAAFTFDVWVASGIEVNAVDRTMQSILVRMAKRNTKGFPFNWLTFVESNAEDLLTAFVALFGATVEEDETLLGEIKGYLGLRNDHSSSPLHIEVVSAITEASSERTDLTKRIRSINYDINILKKAIPDENFEQTLKQLLQYRGALYALRNSINGKNVFNFLTDAGILPNYGFPQSSVTLKSIILHEKGSQKYDGKEDASTDKEEDVIAVTEEYVRPGMIAIRELAPGSTFYSGKRKIRIHKIDVRKNGIEKWRLCNNCAYCEMAATANQEQCPQCDSEMWKDVGREFNMHPLSSATSISSDRHSQSHDETEERERTFHHTRTLVQFDEKTKSNTYACSKSAVPFGFEYLSKATVRVINFGQKDGGRGPVVIAGKEQKTHGFSSCPECGSVRTLGKSFKHEHGCRNTGASVDENEDVFLYHEFESEAVRMLLPAVSSERDMTKIGSFCAALHMGLKLHMGGQLPHLQTTIQDAPITGLETRKTFVFIFDTVPGGTGYLKHLLSDKENILTVLREALEKLNSCKCQQGIEMDGCYKCLFAYRNNYERDRISRKAAIEILEMIVDHGGELKLINSLDKLPHNDLLESMCERAFVDRLASHALKKEGWTCNPTHVNGKLGYELVLPKHRWLVECQVDLGREQGVPVQSRPDFVLWPKEKPDALPIAVFADGFAYHRNRVADDTNKRMAILASQKFNVWTVTWDDLYADEKHYENFLPPTPKISNFLDAFKASRGNLSRVKDVAGGDSITMLLAHLEDPTQNKWEALAYAHALARITGKRNSRWFSRIRKFAPHWFIDLVTEEDDDFAGKHWVINKDKDHTGLVWVRVSYASTQKLDTDCIQAGVYVDDGLNGDHSFKPVWNGFLHAMNVLQFLPNSGFFCKTGLSQNEYDQLAKVWTEPIL